MLSERQADAVVVWAPAKVNLYLEVLAKRADGYHEIATLMVAVSLYDTLEFKEETSGEIQFDCDHPDLAAAPDNLVLRAAGLLRQRTGCRSGARVKLAKRIPIAAGLAGGSTDAAATLAGLNELWRLGLRPSELALLGAELGSDVAFFLPPCPPSQGGEGGIAAWCTGRGEQVAPLALGQPLWFVLVCPPFGLSTAEVYRGVTVPDQPLTGEPILQAVRQGTVEEIGRCLYNRLEPVALVLCPALAGIQAWLAGSGPAGQAMSGSGSSLFALCRDHDEALRIARELHSRADQGMNSRVFIVRSCS